MAFNVPVNTDLSAARRDVASLGEDIQKALDIGAIDLGTTEAIDALEELIAAAELASDATEIQGSADVDVADALQALADIADEVESVSGESVEIDAIVDATEALAALDEIQTEVDLLDGLDATATVTVEADGLDETVSKMGDLNDATVGAASQLSGVLPGAVGASVAALAKLNPALALLAATLGLVEVAGLTIRGAQNTIEIATGASGTALDSLTQSALNVSEEVPASLGDIGEVIGVLNTFLAQTGPLLEDTSEGLVDVARLLGEDATGAALGFAKALNLFGVDAAESRKNLDLLFVATQKYGIGFTELTTVLAAQGGVFQAVGFGLEESINLIGQFNLAGLSASESGPAFIRLIAQAEASGLSFTDQLADLQDQIIGASTAQEAFAIGIEAFGSRGGVSFSQALRTGLVDLTNLTGALGTTSGAIANTAESTVTESQLIREALNGIVAEIAPAATVLAEGLLNVVEVVAELPPGLVALGLAAGAAFAVFGPAGAAVVGVAGGLVLLNKLMETDLDRSLKSVESATDAYTQALGDSLPVNEATEVRLAALIEKYNELAAATDDAADSATGLTEGAVATFYQELDDDARAALDTLIELAGGTEAFTDAILEGDAALGFGLGPSLAKLADQVGQNSDEYKLAIAATKGLTQAQLDDVAATEEAARVRFDNIAGLDAYEQRVRDLGRANRDNTDSLTPFVDAQNHVNRSIEAAGHAAELARTRIYELNAALDEGRRNVADFELEVTDLAINEAILRMEVQFDEAETLEKAAELAASASGVAASTFGNPFAPKIDSEDIAEYLAAVAELQLQVAAFQLNLLVLEAELTPDEFATLLEVFTGAGDESAAAFAAQFVAAIGTEDFDEIRSQLETAVDGADLLATLDEQLGNAQFGLPVEVELDDSQIVALGEQLYGIDVVAGLDTREIEEAIEADYGIVINADLEVTPATIPVDLQFSQQDLDVINALRSGSFANFAEGGTIDSRGQISMMREGGVIARNAQLFTYAGRRFIAGEDPRGPENIEVGPDGVAIVGPYHSGRKSLERLERSGTYRTMEPILRERFNAERIMQSQGATQSVAPLVNELRRMSADMAAAIQALDVGEVTLNVAEALPRTADPTTHYRLLARSIRRARI